MEAGKNDKKQNAEKAGFLLRPSNLAKTIGTQIPGVSALVEMSNQIGSFDFDKRLTSVECELKKRAENADGGKRDAASSLQLQDWPLAVDEYFDRCVTFAISYDASYHSESRRGKELLQPVAQGCLIERERFVTCSEALRLASDVAAEKGGQVVILIGMATYSFSVEHYSTSSDLVTGKILARDEEKWAKVRSIWESNGLPAPSGKLIEIPIKYSVAPYMGQDCGFLHPGEAVDVMTSTRQYSPLQFERFTISHFRKVRESSLKSFVSGILGSRVLQCGSPVFSRSGELLGVIADTESYEGDAGRRVVVLGLIGHPQFRLQK